MRRSIILYKKTVTRFVLRMEFARWEGYFFIAEQFADMYMFTQ